MSNLLIVELIAVITMAISVPTLAMAVWHGWKIEQHKAAEREAVIEEEV